ncbi:MAG: DUF371 domain-containing protein [Candidatus Bathyarchaeota archaeon]|nr:DUF371 domain-containing protein [Candidatus Bathyarchaeota archaeon]
MPANELRETIFGCGHENILATHKTTLEFTRDTHLTKKGNCIIAVGTDKALADLSSEFKGLLRKPNAKLTVIIEAGGIKGLVKAYGSPQLVLTHSTDAVIRKSEFVSDRTLAIRADKAAQDLPRELVEKLRDPRQRVKITLIVRV